MLCYAVLLFGGCVWKVSVVSVSMIVVLKNVPVSRTGVQYLERNCRDVLQRDSRNKKIIITRVDARC